MSKEGHKRQSREKIYHTHVHMHVHTTLYRLSTGRETDEGRQTDKSKDSRHTDGDKNIEKYRKVNSRQIDRQSQ